MNGAEYIAEFLYQRGVQKTYLMTGGACAFIVDAIGRHPKLDYVCLQHEQAAAMAADASWRLNRIPGVTISTSGPGATNLLTGIACSYFDSIPSIHITGQVNKTESAAFLDAKVRQAGFQETDIVAMALPVTKYAVQVESASQLKVELVKAYNIAISGRMGPVLLDVPMNVQKEEAGDVVDYTPPESVSLEATAGKALASRIFAFLAKSERPLVLFGAGVGLAQCEEHVVRWLKDQGLPFVSTWNGMTYFSHNVSGYCGHIGVYGNRGANYILQNCDALLVLGSRLDNRQRSGNAGSFAPSAKVLVLDIDGEELKKYRPQQYDTAQLDFAALPQVLDQVTLPKVPEAWMRYIAGIKTQHFGKNQSSFAEANNCLSPYAVTKAVNDIIHEDAIVIADTGANLCWVYQIFHRVRHTLFTAGGFSPMGYSVPAGIAAALVEPHRQLVCFIGDGGMQVNLQELQTITHYKLTMTVFIFNNYGYGIIKQFQDSYLEGRHEASGRGVSSPDFAKVAAAFGLDYARVTRLEEITPSLLAESGTKIVDVILHPGTLIEPKLEMGRPIHDQFPYVDRGAYAASNPFIRE